jgi:hypothetical protein
MTTTAPAAARRSGKRRRMAGAVALGAVLALAGCYGPIEEATQTIDLECTTTSSNPGSTPTTYIREFYVHTALPAWTDPGRTTPFRLGVAPVVPSIGDGFSPYTAQLTADGLVGDLVFTSVTAPAPVLEVTAEPGGEVVLRLDTVTHTLITPGGPAGPPTQFQTSCVPAPGVSPEIARIPVGAPAT